jgi:thioredoxin-related protein
MGEVDPMNAHARFLYGISLLLLAMVCPGPALASAEEFDDSAVKHIVYPDWFNDGFLDLREDLNAAVTAGRLGLMVMFTTEGCSYCELFIRRSLGDAELAARVQANFAAVGLEIFDDAEMTSPRGMALPVKQFALEEGAEFAPTLVFYGKDGERLLKVVGYQSPERFAIILDYLVGGHFRGESLRDYAGRQAPPAQPEAARAALKDDPLFASPPYMLDRSRIAASRPLLVIFESAGCAECADFHAGVLALDEVRTELDKFEVVRLDADDAATPVVMPDGRRTTPSRWFADTAFTREPGLLFFDERGHEVLRTDALVQRQRMLNSVHFVLERAYEKGWTYQRFARTKASERQK